MTTSAPTRRARRGTLVRSAGWLSATAMIATAAFAPATVSAADPHSMDVACNNIVHGGRSPEYVWATIGDAGVTANWATDADHFDAANHETVTIRVCAIDADGDDQGAIDQDTENDGSQLFPWSLLGYETNPCPDDSLSFGASADSPAVNTKKSNLIDCPAGEVDQPTDNGDQPTDGVDDPSDGVDQPTDGADDPSDGADDPSDGVDEPTDGVDEPTDGVDEPTDGADDPSDGVDEPTDGVDDPSDGVDEPTDSVDDPSDNGGDQPTGAVEGAVGTPGVTPPPTDTSVIAPAPAGGDGWRLVLVLVAAALVGSLAASQPRRAHRKA